MVSAGFSEDERPSLSTDHSSLTTNVRICCGPRCGAVPGHRVIYAAVERVAAKAGINAVPTMCRSACSGGVTVISPGGTVKKVSDVSAANTVLDALSEPSAQP